MKFSFEIEIDAELGAIRHIRKFLWIPKHTSVLRKDGGGYKVEIYWLCTKTIMQRYVSKTFKFPFSCDWYWEDVGIDESVIILPDQRSKKNEIPFRPRESLFSAD